jgi:hypothetical protein
MSEVLPFVIAFVVTFAMDILCVLFMWRSTCSR